jgi:small subunit ribosomal protein S16
MAVHIRLARHGSRKAPFFRVVVSDQRNSRDGRFIEHIGLFNPRASAAAFTVDQARYEYWTQQGAVPSATVHKLVKQSTTKSA